MHRMDCASCARCAPNTQNSQGDSDSNSSALQVAVRPRSIGETFARVALRRSPSSERKLASRKNSKQLNSRMHCCVRRVKYGESKDATRVATRARSIGETSARVAPHVSPSSEGELASRKTSEQLNSRMHCCARRGSKTQNPWLRLVSQFERVASRGSPALDWGDIRACGAAPIDVERTRGSHHGSAASRCARGCIAALGAGQRRRTEGCDWCRNSSALQVVVRPRSIGDTFARVALRRSPSSERALA
jgi:hypothetical protein